MFASFVFLHISENLESFTCIGFNGLLWKTITGVMCGYSFLVDSQNFPKQLNRWLRYKNKHTEKLRKNNKTVWNRGGCSSNSNNRTIYIEFTSPSAFFPPHYHLVAFVLNAAFVEYDQLNSTEKFGPRSSPLSTADLNQISRQSVLAHVKSTTERATKLVSFF